MKVRVVIFTHRGVKYRIDGVFYESEMHIPEIIRDKVVDFYGLLDGIIIIRTKNMRDII